MTRTTRFLVTVPNVKGADGGDVTAFLLRDTLQNFGPFDPREVKVKRAPKGVLRAVPQPVSTPKT